MAEPASREATYEDLRHVPPPLVAEILYGQLHTHPRPAPHHALASSALGTRLFDPFGRGAGGPGGWWILDEPEIHLGKHVVVPDIAGWRRERLPTLPETAWLGVAPDWVCEVLSPATAQTDRSIKLPLYAGQGVGHCWLVDPLLRTLEACSLRGGQLAAAGHPQGRRRRTPPALRRDRALSRRPLALSLTAREPKAVPSCAGTSSPVRPPRRRRLAWQRFRGPRRRSCGRCSAHRPRRRSCRSRRWQCCSRRCADKSLYKSDAIF